MSIKKVVESHKPKGVIYHYAPCGHTYFMSQEEVKQFVYGAGADAPRTCPTCEAA